MSSWFDSRQISCSCPSCAFCMVNRYIDGLNTRAPDNPDLYRYLAQTVTDYGYTSDDHYMPAPDGCQT